MIRVTRTILAAFSVVNGTVESWEKMEPATRGSITFRLAGVTLR
jgi:hypothetical protein